MSSRLNNVIPFTINADFFNDIAAKSLERYNYSKALRFFQRAVDLEPNNPQNVFNTAGVLARLGKYEKSIELLQHVLNDMDSNAVECHYYLACNYTNLDMFELAEKHALEYLEKAPMGPYSEETIELLYFLSAELNHESTFPKDFNFGGEADEKTLLHDEARDLMEKGQFQQAEKILLKLTQDYPDFVAASNNLSLCYYYKGEFEKAQKTIFGVLEEDPANIHALCNLAVLYYQFQDEENLNELLNKLKKIVPLQYDQAYKLGITLGVMGEHGPAYQIFKQMASYAWQFDFQLLHYCAVAAFNLGLKKEAEKYWRMVQREQPRSTVARFYLNELAKQEVTIKDVPYYYHVPMEHAKREKDFTEEVEKDPFVRSSFLWALRHGDRETKLQVLQAFEWLGDQEVVEALLEFVRSTEEDEELKKIARFVLRTLGHSVSESGETLQRKKGWENVVALIERMDRPEDREKAMEIWNEFIAAQSQPPIIRKPEAWVAALAWILSEDDKELKSISMKYGVSIRTIMKNAKIIQDLT